MMNRYTTIFSSSVIAAATLGTPIFAQDNIIKTTWYSDWGSAKYSQPFEHLDYVNPNAPKGGEIAIAQAGTFDSLNPYATGIGTPAIYSSIAFERIMATTSDETQASLYCLLCESIEYPEDKAWIILNLRDDVAFSDGKLMSAEDVAYTYGRMRAEFTPSWRAGAEETVESHEVLDTHKIKFTFKEDAADSRRIPHVGSLLVMQKEWLENNDVDFTDKGFHKVIGTGPYVIGDYKTGDWIEYDRNPNYWGINHPLMKGRSNFDKIRINYYGDPIAAFEAFKAGDVSFRRENSSLQWSTSYDFPALDEGWVVKKTLPNGLIPPSYGYLFNLRREKFQDRNLREAIGLMYNFNWTNNNLQFGLFNQRTSFWDAPEFRAEGLPTGKELALLNEVRDLLPEEIFTQDAKMPHTSGTRLLDRRNLRKALALMEKAGWVPDDKGMLRNQAGEPLKIELLHFSPSWDRFMNPLVENFRALGIDAVYTRVDPNEYQSRTQRFDYDMIYDGYVSGFEEGSGLAQRLGCADVDDIFNPAGYCNPAFDHIAERILDAETHDDMKAMIRAADRILRYDYFIIPAHKLDEHWVAYYDMYEHPNEEIFTPLALGFLDFWWYNAEKGEKLRAQGATRVGE